jgi:hypothetical protein
LKAGSCIAHGRKQMLSRECTNGSGRAQTCLDETPPA